MTHDKLLDKIESIEYWQEHFANKTFLKALRAVVELTGEDIKHESYVWLDGYDFAMKRIIQAIEKELE